MDVRLDAAALEEIHTRCVTSVNGTTSAEDFEAWLEGRDIDIDDLFAYARGGAVEFSERLAINRSVEAIMLAIVAGFEWGYRAREHQEMFG